eukprot:3939170-Rhodomonas_salina.6
MPLLLVVRRNSYPGTRIPGYPGTRGYLIQEIPSQRGTRNLAWCQWSRWGRNSGVPGYPVNTGYPGPPAARRRAKITGPQMGATESSLPDYLTHVPNGVVIRALFAEMPLSVAFRAVSKLAYGNTTTAGTSFQVEQTAC